MSRLYDLVRWRKGRLRHLADNPTCVSCRERNILTIATVVDHNPPHDNTIETFFDEATWRSMCKPCHDSVTARADGGWGNKRKRDRSTPIQPGTDAAGVPTDPKHHWNRK